MIQNKELWFTRAKNLNDPYDCYHSSLLETQYSCSKVGFDINHMLQSTGICSLTDSPLNFLLWSYYNEHTGICVGIDTQLIKERLEGYHPNVKSLVALEKVKYQEELPKMQPLECWKKMSDEESEEMINDFYSTKSVWWEHENEYRLILRRPGGFNDKWIKVRVKGLIKSVYFGCKYGINKDEVLAHARDKNIEVYEVLLKKDKFGLEHNKLL